MGAQALAGGRRLAAWAGRAACGSLAPASLVAWGLGVCHGRWPAGRAGLLPDRPRRWLEHRRGLGGAEADRVIGLAAGVSAKGGGRRTMKG